MVPLNLAALILNSLLRNSFSQDKNTFSIGLDLKPDPTGASRPALSIWVLLSLLRKNKHQCILFLNLFQSSKKLPELNDLETTRP